MVPPNIKLAGGLKKLEEETFHFDTKSQGLLALFLPWKQAELLLLLLLLAGYTFESVIMKVVFD